MTMSLGSVLEVIYLCLLALVVASTIITLERRRQREAGAIGLTRLPRNRQTRASVLAQDPTVVFRASNATAADLVAVLDRLTPWMIAEQLVHHPAFTDQVAVAVLKDPELRRLAASSIAVRADLTEETRVLAALLTHAR
jgi:hypothetical protein